MAAKREVRDRDPIEVAVLDALVERGEEGMTVLELRTQVDAGIDDLEDALAALKSAGLIDVERDSDRMVLYPDDAVVPEPGQGEGEGSIVEAIRRRFPFL